MSSRIRDELEAALAEPSVVRVKRGSFDAAGELAYVAALGTELALLICISNEIRFDGFAIIRIQDITELEAPHDHADFVEEALRLRGESVEEAPAVPVTNMDAAIRASGRLFPLVVLHREAADPDVCHVGKVAQVAGDSVTLAEIDPDAEWDEEPTSYSVLEVTRIEFGGGYEEALALVGGEGPSVRHLKPVS